MSEFAGEIAGLARSLAADAVAPADGQVSDLWPQIQELGLIGIGIAEQDGGSGGELADLVVAIRELARAGIDTPLVEASTAAYALGMPAADTFDTVANAPGCDNQASARDVDLGIVAFAPLAKRLVVIGESALRTVELADVELEPVIDIAGRPAGRVRVTGMPATAESEISVIQLRNRLALARAASLVGNAWGAYTLTRDYVVSRQQFGAPLIEIPSVATALAQLVVQIRAAEVALDHAVDTLGEPAASAAQGHGSVAAARIAAAQTATLVARTTHQLHGAVGITREYNLHRYTRALWAQRDADESEQNLAGRLGATTLAAGEDVLWGELSA